MSAFEEIFGCTPWVSLGVTLIFMGGCAALTGQALAATWRPPIHAAPYALLLACADRFLIYSLFHGQLLSASGYLLDAVLLITIALTTYRAILAGKMVRQYPWLYEQNGWFGWREKEMDQSDLYLTNQS